jgi:hypothetical protein
MAYDARLNARIVTWLRARPVGSAYGNGECWTLAEDALIQAGARTSRQLTPRFSSRADFVWGDVETSLNEIHPGDIIQFVGYSAVLTTTVADFLAPRGRVVSPTQTHGRGHHTAIVLRVLVPGCLVEVIEQNVARLPVAGVPQSARVVQINRIALRTVVGPTEVSFDGLGDRVTTTISYAVSLARFTIYHPTL